MLRMDAPMQSPSSGRSLPPNDLGTIQTLTNSTLEDHYVMFIFHCNPTLAANLSTTELRRGFRSVPRSDGKSFETLNFFRLVCKHDTRVIQTWNQLVTELGVEPPNLAKGGSGQKLQQYAVRLKRWAHAYHIDSFFQYLQGNTHPYFTQIPRGPDALQIVRDGVAPEDDLALRALIPDLRPKRGRKKGYDDDNESIDTPSKRLRAGTPSTVDGRNSPRPDLWGRVSQSPAPSYIPHPSTQHLAQLLPGPARTQQTPVYAHDEHLNELFANAGRAFGTQDGLNATQSAVIQTNPTQLQTLSSWPTPNGRLQNGYPQSAIDLHPPSNAFDSPDLNDGSRSAHPLMAGRNVKSKRKGGRGVSAAWNASSGNNGIDGPRPRGRPVGNAKSKNGLFETWSVKESIESDRDMAQTDTFTQPMPNNNPKAAVAPMQQMNTMSTSDTSQPHRIPTKKLSLTVPHQPSGNIRLATPPGVREQAKANDTDPLPRVTLNDDGSLSRPRSSTSKTRERESLIQRERQRNRLHAEERALRRSSADFFNTIDEEISHNHDYDDYKNDLLFDEDMRNESATIDWKQRAMVLARKLKQAQEELRRVKKAVLEAVM